MAQLKFTHGIPADDVGLFTRYVDAEVSTYQGVLFRDWEERIKQAYLCQDFGQVQYLLIRSACYPTMRYYPVPLLLDLTTKIPAFAQSAAERLLPLLRR